MMVCVSILAVVPLRSQADEKLPKDFYRRDYASAPGYEETQGHGVQSPSRPKPPRLTSSPIPGPQGSQIPKDVSNTGKADTSSRPTIHLFVSSLDHGHFARVVEGATRIHDRGHASVKALFHIGDYEAVTPEIEQRLEQRGIALVQVGEVPVELFAEVSPVWRVATPIGYHVAEGFIEIDRFFDEWGEFNPARGEEKKISSNMDGF